MLHNQGINIISNVCNFKKSWYVKKHSDAPKCCTNVGVLHGVAFEFYERQFPSAKNPHEMRDRISCGGSLSSVYQFLKNTGSKYSISSDG
jgi:hypothetical protein